MSVSENGNNLAALGKWANELPACDASLSLTLRPAKHGTHIDRQRETPMTKDRQRCNESKVSQFPSGQWSMSGQIATERKPLHFVSLVDVGALSVDQSSQCCVPFLASFLPVRRFFLTLPHCIRDRLSSVFSRSLRSWSIVADRRWRVPNWTY